MRTWVNPYTSIADEESSNGKIIFDNMILDVNKLKDASQFSKGSLDDAPERFAKMLEIYNEASGGKLFEKINNETHLYSASLSEAETCADNPKSL